MYHMNYAMAYIFFIFYTNFLNLIRPFICILKQKCQIEFIFYCDFVKSKTLGERQGRDIFMKNNFF